MERWLKICHNGEMKFVDLPCSSEHHDPTYPFLHAVYRELDCDSIEIVRTKGFDALFSCRECMIIIDGCGKLKEGFENRINNLCTLNYAPGMDCIVGDALLGFRMGPEILPFPEEMYRHFIGYIESIFDDFHFVEA